MLNRMYLNFLWNVLKHFLKYQIAVIILWSVLDTETAFCSGESIESPTKLLNDDFQYLDLDSEKKDQFFEGKNSPHFVETFLENEIPFDWRENSHIFWMYSVDCFCVCFRNVFILPFLGYSTIVTLNLKKKNFIRPRK